ncbi:MAG TPA: alkaline phosphatase family protein [Gemmatimonadaceae bacterium]|nr:alkaline phosphatase family protein [Gemmatimonadaceae bacterium]
MPRLAAGLRAPFLIIASAGVLHAQGDPVPPAPVAAPPTLVVLVTIDQFRADYLDRFGPQFRGGLARLIRGGARFTDAHQDHAITETAPGHATLLSGRFPRSTGITMNSVGVADEAAPLIASGYGPGASPRRFVGSTLIDWLQARDPRSRALSVSVKDRGAILPVGRSRAEVFWYSPDGRFTTSRYYRESLPPWVEGFNDRHLPQTYAGRRWSLLLADSAYHERDSVSAEGTGTEIVFPHALPDDAADAASLIRATPFIDEVTVAFALHGVRSLGLGTGPQTDLLAVSLSASDFVGHRFGPDSREMHDQVLRVDRTVGVLLDSLYRMRDSSRVVVVLTSDHGVGSIPEYSAAFTNSAARRVELLSLMPGVRARLRAAGVDTLAVAIEQEFVVVNRGAFRSASSADALIDWLAAAVRRVPGVRRVDRFATLVADSLRDPVARRWSHQLPASAPVELIVTLDSLNTWGGNVASHGSSYDYDSRVPLIFAGAGIRAGRYTEFVRTVDIAPTLAELAGVTPGERLDGVILRPALRSPHASAAP